MHPELNTLSLELKLNGKYKHFYDIDSFLQHIFEWVDISENAFQGYHSEYLYPNMFGLHITKKFPGGVYQAHFNGEKIKSNGSNMFPKDLSPKELIDAILKNLSGADYLGKCKDIPYKKMVIHVSFTDGKIFRAYPNTHFTPMQHT